MSSAVQMNVRIDRDLKDQADRILAKHGISPSQAVRALYEGITGTKQRSDEVFDVVFQQRSKNSDIDAERASKLKSIRKVQESICDVDAAFFAASIPVSEKMSDKDLLEEAIFEHYSSKDMLE